MHRLLIAQGVSQGSIHLILRLARERGVPIQITDRSRLDALERHHQGVIALIAAYAYVDVDDLLERARVAAQDPLLLVLDGIQDPQNLGALLRTCDAVGAHGIVLPERRSVGLTATVAKVSSGAIEYVPVARVTNLVRTLEELKAAGLWICGADPGAAAVYHQTSLTGPLAIVIGSEGKGIGRLVSEHCDLRVRIPMQGRVNSLNAATAGALLLFEVLRQRSLEGGVLPGTRGRP